MPDSQVERYPITDDQKVVLQEAASGLTDSFSEWLSYFDDRFYSIGFSLAFFHVFATPADTKSSLALFLENVAKVSRSTADRMIREAEAAGHLVVRNKEGARGKAVFLGDALFNHCIDYLGKRTKPVEANSELLSTMADIERSSSS